jgi:hypothetical protein
MLGYLYGKRFGSKIAWAKAQAIFEPSLFPYKYSNILKPSHPLCLSAYEDGTECSETSAYKIQKPGNYPEESIPQKSHSSCFDHPNNSRWEVQITKLYITFILTAYSLGIYQKTWLLTIITHAIWRLSNTLHTCIKPKSSWTFPPFSHCR